MNGKNYNTESKERKNSWIERKRKKRKENVEIKKNEK